MGCGGEFDPAELGLTDTESLHHVEREAATDACNSATPGLVRFKVWIEVPNAAGEIVGSTIRFVANGIAVPRIGETMHFDVAPGGLALTVVDVAHWFSPAAEDEPHEVSVEAKLSDSDVRTARTLLDPAALRRWIALFPHLEWDSDPYDHDDDEP
ncbi:hypothetical protein ACFXHA_43510 [Nocardia sp. NPDC059240]|uniref:hypothetical protein n=1 Tax=Nocardia sp. NPDC059240 TaxID=3346786 RepID=UPI00368218F9